MRRLEKIFSACSILILLSACVSVGIGGGGGGSQSKKADDVQFVAPAKPFEKFDAVHVDHAWKNEKNGNSISYLSECNTVADPSLENIHRGLVSSIDNVANIEKQLFQFNGRESLRSTATGQVDGVSSKFDLVVFKKNGCTYILSYVATEANFDSNHKDFDRFLDGFKSP